MARSFLTELRQRRVLQLVGLYLGVAWGVIQFVDWLVKRYLLSSHLIDIALLSVVSLAPSVAILAWTHGAPGRDRWGRAEKLGIPLNLAAAALLLVLVFQGKELGAATETILVVDEEGQSAEREVPRAVFRREVALFFWANETGDPAHDWLRYGVPQILARDLEQDVFLDVTTPYSGWQRSFHSRLARAGFADALDVPLALARQVAGDFHIEYFVDGAVEREGSEWALRARLFGTATLDAMAEHRLTGPDLLALVDRLTVLLKEDLGVPSGSESLALDLPVAEHLSDSFEAIEAWIAGLSADLFGKRVEAAIAHWQRAVELDPSCTAPRQELMTLLANSGRMAEAGAQIAALRPYEYKIPERDRFLIKAWDYSIRGETAKVIAVYEMWSQLYPTDVTALAHLANAYLWNGNYLEKALAAYRRIRQVDPAEDWVLKVVASLLVVLGREAEAIAALEEYAKLYPDEYPTFVQLGWLRLEGGDFAAARQLFEKAEVVGSSGVVGPRLALAELELREGNVEAALAHLRDAETIAVTPQATRLVIRAWIELLAVRGQIRAAVELLPRLIEVESRFVSPLNIMADSEVATVELLVLAGEKDRALSRLAEIAEAIEPPYDAFAELGFLAVHLRAGDAVRAVPHLAAFAAFIEDIGRSDLAYRVAAYRGRLLVLEGDPAAAAAAFERALELHGASVQSAFGDRRTPVELLTRLGGARRRAGELEAARDALEAALRRFPSYPEAHLELARLEEARGRPEAAHSHLELARQMWRDADPDYPPAQEARAGELGRPLG